MIFRSKIKGVVFEIKATGLAEAVQVAKTLELAAQNQEVNPVDVAYFELEEVIEEPK